nr:cyclic GMP-AMP synthase [Nothobranchius furzeri]
MAGRERPQRPQSPDSKPKELKLAPSGRCTTFKNEKQNETAKTSKRLDQQKKNHTEDKPSVPMAGKTKNKEEIHNQLVMPEENIKAKTCSTRRKLQDNPPGDMQNTQQDTPPEIQKSLKKTSPKANGKAKLQGQNKDPTELEQLPEKTATQTKTPAAMKAKKCNDKVLQKRTEALLVKTYNSSKDRTDDDVDCTLKKILENLKIRSKERSDSSQVINYFMKHLIEYLKDHSIRFKNVKEPLRTGSYYENLKISNPDEFDVMLPIPVERVNIEPFDDNGAFYSVVLKRDPTGDENPLKKFQQDNILSSYEMLKEFRKEVKKFAKVFPEWEMTAKKPRCPAVTLTRKVESVIISLDVVLCLEVKSTWPTFTKDGFKIEGWLGTKAKRNYKWKPYYLVPKYEGRGDAEKGGVLAKNVWRVSFSHIEKDIMKNHGSERTCCEKAGESCCRKNCLKLLKHLLHLLKEQDSSFVKFCSYHVKTMLLHACCSRTKDGEWRASDLSHCFEVLLKDFESHLRTGELCNFFIPKQNLLSGVGKNQCIKLADSIKEQCDKGFPVFRKDLCNT